MAEFKLRALASMAPTAKDKLAVVKRVFPDAKYDSEGEIVYTDPTSKQTVQLDPKGLDWGDLADLADVGVGIAGSIGGAAAGGLAGGLPAFAGAAAGGPALKALIQKGLVESGSLTDSRQEGEGITDFATETGLNALTAGTIGLIGKGAKATLGPQYKEAIKYLKSKGYTPTLGDVGSSTGKGIGRYASDPTQQVMQGNLGKLQQKVLQASGGELTNPGAFGTQIVGSLSQQVSGLKNQSSVIYNELRGATRAKVPLQGLPQRINSVLSEIAENGVIPDAIKADLGSAAAAIAALQSMKEVSPQVLRALRRSIGSAAKDSPFGPVLMKVNEEITDHLGSFYTSISPQLGQKYQLAEQLYSQYSRQKDILRQTLGKTTADTIIKGEPDAIASEAVANQLTNLLANPTGGQKLSSLLQILPAEQRDMLGKYALNQAAQKSVSNAPVGEIFNPTAFLKNMAPYTGAKEAGLLSPELQATMQGLQQEAQALAPGAQTLMKNVDAGGQRILGNPFTAGTTGGGLGAVVAGLAGLPPAAGAAAGIGLGLGARKATEMLASSPQALARLATITPSRVALGTQVAQEALNDPAAYGDSQNTPTPPTGTSNEVSGPKGGIPDLDSWISGVKSPQAGGAKAKLPSIEDFIAKSDAQNPPKEAALTPLNPDEVESLLGAGGGQEQSQGLTPLSEDEANGLLKTPITPTAYRPNSPESFQQALVKNKDLLTKSGITGERLNHFLAQLAHESGGFKHLNEIDPSKSNLSDKGGETYKGRGWIQLTGNSNYKKYGDMVGVDLLNNPELAADPDVALKTAVAYWNTNGLNKLADQNNIRAITKRINGGYNGLQDRSQWLDSIRGYGGFNFLGNNEESI